MQVDSKFKRLMIDYPGIIRASILTDHQIDVFKHVEKEGGGIYSRQLADYFGISVQSAGATLSKIAKAGYLQQLSVNAPSGGTEYFYRTTIHANTQ